MMGDGCLQRLQDYLRSQGVEFQIINHPPAYTAQELAAIEHIKGRFHAKVVMAFAGDRLVMLVLPASHKVDLDKLKAELGVPAVRLAEEPEFSSVFPDCEVGAMPPFGNLYGIPVYVDVSLQADPWIAFLAGSHTVTMKISYADYERLVRPTVKSFAVHI
jgi:Ala-tRNA(Pro) deacylase